MVEHFGTVLREIRTQKKIYLKELAEKMGWSIVYLSDIERGRRNPPAKNFISQLAEFLNVKASHLLNAADRERGFVELNLNNATSTKTKAALTLARSWNNLTEEDWDEIIKLISEKHGTDGEDHER